MCHSWLLRILIVFLFLFITDDDRYATDKGFNACQNGTGGNFFEVQVHYFIVTPISPRQKNRLDGTLRISIAVVILCGLSSS